MPIAVARYPILQNSNFYLLSKLCYFLLLLFILLKLKSKTENIAIKSLQNKIELELFINFLKSLYQR